MLLHPAYYEALPAGKTLPGWPSKPAAQQLIYLISCLRAGVPTACQAPADRLAGRPDRQQPGGGTCWRLHDRRIKVSRSHVIFKAANAVLAADRTQYHLQRRAALRNASKGALSCRRNLSRGTHVRPFQPASSLKTLHHCVSTAMTAQ